MFKKIYFDATHQSDSISKAELISALSYALDLTEGQALGHSVRCCWIGMNIGQFIGLDAQTLDDLYYTLLLKDVGCSSNAARICNLYATDDILFKRGIKSVNDSLPQVVRFVLEHTGLKANLSERFRLLLNTMAHGKETTRELFQTRCQRGAEIARQLKFSEAVAQGILDLDEHWNGKGQPTSIEGETISLFARIALIAQVTDVFHTSAGPQSAIEEVTRRAGSWFDPALTQAFCAVAEQPDFWTTLAAADLNEKIIAMAPQCDGHGVGDDYLDDVAAAFAQVVDSKSPFTSGHSDRVALYTDMIALEMGLGAEHRRFLKRAALLHDIGKLGVSNQILDKASKLDEDEWVLMRRHSLNSEIILSRINAFKNLSIIAGAHHERLDGKGYPYGLKDAQINLETRIITTADIFDALTANRPYRKAMTTNTALEIMAKDISTAIDPECFAALVRVTKSLAEAVEIAA
eukprot:gene2436-2474_t